MTATPIHPTTRVARDLSAILDLADDLHEQAANDGDSPDLPGGDALVALAPVANLESWEYAQATTERTGRELTAADLEDPDNLWPPLQRLVFWSEALRREHDSEWDTRPTIATEAQYLRWMLDWLWDNEPAWDDFAGDVAAVKTALETILTAGKRTTKGVPCLSCGTDLVRPNADPRRVDECDGHDGVCHLPHARCPHDRGGQRDWWKCPGCDRWYPEEDYRRAVAELAAVNADWLTLEQVVDRTGAKGGTVKVWATRGRVRRRKDVETGRTQYHVEDVRLAQRGTLVS